MSITSFLKNKTKNMSNTTSATQKVIVHPFISSDIKAEAQATLSVELMEWLLKNKNPRNRPLNRNRIEQYKDDILNSQWKNKTGNAILFDWSGNILDAQHRITAHVEAKKPLTATIIYGLDPTSMDYIDGNVSRTEAVRSVLSCSNVYTSPTEINAAIKQKQLQFKVARLWHQAENDFKKYKRMSKATLEDFVTKKSTTLGQVLQPVANKKAKRAGYLTAMAMFFEKDSIQAQAFFDEVGAADGIPIPPNSSSLLLRKYLANETCGGGGMVQRRDFRVALSMINHFVKGTCPLKITYSETLEF